MYTSVGIAKKYGQYKVKWANGLLKYRITTYEQQGFSDIQMFELPEPMDKYDAVMWLKHNHTFTPDQAHAIDIVINKKTLEKQKQLTSKI
jgi:hypothetical protein